MAPHGPFSHTLRGIALFTLPAALVVLWLFHRCVKAPLVLALSDSVQQRLIPYLGQFEFFPFARFALILLSILVGIATHIIWDSFTHPNSWLYDHWSFLRHTLYIPGWGYPRYCRVLQYFCSVLGLAILWVWAHRWYHTTKPADRGLDRELSSTGKVILLGVVPVLAFVGGLLRGIFEAHAHPQEARDAFIGAALVTTISLAWWQLVLCSFLVKCSFFTISRGVTAADWP